MIVIKIKTENAAFRGCEGAARMETARILEELSDRLKRYALRSPKLMDVNGNAAGEIRLTGKERGWL